MAKYNVFYSDGTKEVVEGDNFLEVYNKTKDRAIAKKLSVRYERI